MPLAYLFDDFAASGLDAQLSAAGLCGRVECGGLRSAAA